ncbi:MAG: hypothetical protein U0271_36385 [Polyangiaceae bacterium]
MKTCSRILGVLSVCLASAGLLACGDNGASGGSGGSGGSSSGGSSAGGAGGGAAAQFCETQHADTFEGAPVIVCDTTFASAPFLHLPAPTTLGSGNVEGYFALTMQGFSDGVETHALPNGSTAPDDEALRHAFALYRVELDAGGAVVDFAPAVFVDERNFLRFFEGMKLEGLVSKETGVDTYELDPTLPIFLSFGTAELADDTDPLMPRYRIPITVNNLVDGAVAEDGTCLTPLDAGGATNPFAAFPSDLVFDRVPSMHGPFDDEATVSYGDTGASVMAPAFYVDAATLIRSQAPSFDVYEGWGHGTPGSMPNIFVHVVNSGGEPCNN